MIDAGKALELLREQVQGNEGRVYKSPIKDGVFHGRCVYWHGDCPSCLVGEVLWASGLFEPWDLSAMDSLDAPIVAGNLSDRFPDRVTPEAAYVLSAAQEAQDTGSTWGQALARAGSAHRFVMSVED